MGYRAGRETRPGVRVVWQRYEEPDPQTGRPVLKCVWPSYRPARITSWRDRFQTFGGVDAVVGLVALVLLALAVVTS